MKITVNTAALSAEQVKFLTQLGEFRHDQWESHFEPEDMQDVIDLLKRAICF